MARFLLTVGVILSKSQLNAKTTFSCSKMLPQNDEKQPLMVHFWPRKVKNLAFSCDFDNMDVRTGYGRVPADLAATSLVDDRLTDRSIRYLNFVQSTAR